MAYCRNCGKPLSTEAVICPACGVPSPKGNAYCWNCGNGVSPLAEMCVKCGVRLNTAGGKSKTSAVVLSVFLGFWSWLYTYKRNAWKFWLSLLLVIAAVVGYFVLRSVLDWSPAFYLCLALPVIVWLWAIIDVSVRKSEFYEQY